MFVAGAASNAYQLTIENLKRISPVQVVVARSTRHKVIVLTFGNVMYQLCGASQPGASAAPLTFTNPPQPCLSMVHTKLTRLWALFQDTELVELQPMNAVSATAPTMLLSLKLAAICSCLFGPLYTVLALNV